MTSRQDKTRHWDWGGWEFDGGVLRHRSLDVEYAIELIRFMSASKMLNMIMALTKHDGRATDACIVGLIRALIDIEAMTPQQRVMCAGLTSSLSVCGADTARLARRAGRA
jgi:hypothetical protein